MMVTSLPARRSLMAAARGVDMRHAWPSSRASSAQAAVRNRSVSVRPNGLVNGRTKRGPRVCVAPPTQRPPRPTHRPPPPTQLTLSGVVGFVGWFLPEITTSSDVSDVGDDLPPPHTGPAYVLVRTWFPGWCVAVQTICKRSPRRAHLRSVPGECVSPEAAQTQQPGRDRSAPVDTVGTPGVIGDRERRDSLRRVLRFSCCLAPQRQRYGALVMCVAGGHRKTLAAAIGPNGLGPIRGVLRYLPGLAGRTSRCGLPGVYSKGVRRFPGARAERRQTPQLSKVRLA